MGLRVVDVSGEHEIPEPLDVPDPLGGEADAGLESVFDSSSQEATLVVLSCSGRWQSWVTAELLGKRTVFLAVEQTGETAVGLSGRIVRLVTSTTARVSNLIWLREGSALNASWILDLADALGDQLSEDYRIRVVGSQNSSIESLKPRAGVRSAVDVSPPTSLPEIA